MSFHNRSFPAGTIARVPRGPHGEEEVEKEGCGIGGHPFRVKRVDMDELPATATQFHWQLSLFFADCSPAAPGEFDDAAAWMEAIRDSSVEGANGRPRPDLSVRRGRRHIYRLRLI